MALILVCTIGNIDAVELVLSMVVKLLLLFMKLKITSVVNIHIVFNVKKSQQE
jgi:hypothetical protein